MNSLLLILSFLGVSAATFLATIVLRKSPKSKGSLDETTTKDTELSVELTSIRETIKEILTRNLGKEVADDWYKEEEKK